MKNKKIKITIFIIFLIMLIIFCIPVKKGKGSWVNDSEIYDVGHYQTAYYNIFGIKIFEK